MPSDSIAALKCFFRFCLENQYLEHDPASALRTPKKHRSLPDILNRRELGQLLDAPVRDDVRQRIHTGKLERDRLLLALFAYSGLRHAELLGLDVSDIDLERRD